jgi:hypothetical protein
MEGLLQHMAGNSYSLEEQYQRLWLAAMLQHWYHNLYATTLADNAAYMVA